MAQTFDLGRYECAHLLGKLWKVTHGNSQSFWENHTGDLVAANQSLSFHNQAELQKAVQKHVDWGRRSPPSCFLSVFTSENHAFNWARIVDRDKKPAYILEIETARLTVDPGTMSGAVLDMEVLIDRLGIENPWSEHELLFLYRIPSDAIVSHTPFKEYTVQGMKECHHDHDQQYHHVKLTLPSKLGMEPL